MSGRSAEELIAAAEALEREADELESDEASAKTALDEAITKLRSVAARVNSDRGSG